MPVPPFQAEHTCLFHSYILGFIHIFNGATPILLMLLPSHTAHNIIASGTHDARTIFHGHSQKLLISLLVEKSILIIQQLFQDAYSSLHSTAVVTNVRRNVVSEFVPQSIHCGVCTGLSPIQFESLHKTGERFRWILLVVIPSIANKRLDVLRVRIWLLSIAVAIAIAIAVVIAVVLGIITIRAVAVTVIS
jgi:hypothetical protein